MKKILLVGFVFLVMLGIGVTPVSANTKTEFTGTSNFVEQIGDFDRDWYSGVAYHIRGLLEKYTLVTTDPRLTGDSFQCSNVNFFSTDPPVYFYGPIWGTDHIENDGGYWTGTFSGKRTKEFGFSYFIEILHGHGGYEGLIARIHFVREMTDPYGPIQAYGVVIEPQESSPSRLLPNTCIWQELSKNKAPAEL